MSEELKKLLKPPFYHDHGYIHDASNPNAAVALVGYDQEIVCDFIVSAMTEKWERDSIKPMRWEKEFYTLAGKQTMDYKCGKCGKSVMPINPFDYNFCPYCGQKLNLPEGDKIMEHEIVLKLTLRESDYLSELLCIEGYGSGSDVKGTVMEKLENARLEVLKIIAGGNK